MHRELLDFLVAPTSGGLLTLEADDSPSPSATIRSGSLIAADGSRYPIREGVPRMIPEDRSSATIDEGATQRTFAAKWAEFDEDHRGLLAEYQHLWFEERYGFADEADLARFLASRRRVLDAGTGLGTFAARCARLCDAQVVGMDLCDSVTAARDRYAELENLDYVQGDILNPPFPPESFDLVVADAVLHHTPDCSAAFEKMARLVRPGGQLAVYVYRKKALIRELVDDHVRALTSSLSVEECMELSRQITELGRELSRLQATITLEHGVPLLGIQPGMHDVQRLIYWTMLKCYWNEERGWRDSVMTNFDWYSPVYASRHTEDEVLGWCRHAGLDVVHLDVIESGISVRAAAAS
jgi:SAM-dependent methyltransferase/uncharacterized protein YbaR (Trm112 family)